MDHYQRLQVTRDADPEVIGKAYRTLSLKHHPDRASDDPSAATERMQQINEAYRVLRNPVLRDEYDRTLDLEGGATAWDQFMAKGLLGLFLDRTRSSR
ncbi:MAG TPA: J domain-containing protein [Coriobacteriia bacterium]|nr:J domain-containing protein [Coriobacteriia bacterium]